MDYVNRYMYLRKADNSPLDGLILWQSALTFIPLLVLGTMTWLSETGLTMEIQAE